MKIRILLTCLIGIFLSGADSYADRKMLLPEPDTSGGMPVQSAIYARKSIRRYSGEPLTIQEVSQVLWSAGGATVDGVTGPTRAYPSAGGTYPLEIYLVAGNVDGLDQGVYRYDWEDNTLELIQTGDIRTELSQAAYGQTMLVSAPVTIVVTAVYEKTTRRYGERGRSLFVPMDAGHLGQNVHLQAISMGLGTVMVAGFDADRVDNVLQGTEGTPIYMMPVGHEVN